MNNPGRCEQCDKRMTESEERDSIILKRYIPPNRGSILLPLYNIHCHFCDANCFERWMEIYQYHQTPR